METRATFHYPVSAGKVGYHMLKSIRGSVSTRHNTTGGHRLAESHRLLEERQTGFQSMNLPSQDASEKAPAHESIELIEVLTFPVMKERCCQIRQSLTSADFAAHGKQLHDEHT